MLLGFSSTELLVPAFIAQSNCLYLWEKRIASRDFSSCVLARANIGSCGTSLYITLPLLLVQY